MPFSVNPSTVAPGGSLTATGTGARKRPARIRVAATDPQTPNAQLASFVMPASGKFSRTIPAPEGTPREVTLALQQTRPTDGAWAQTASVTIRLLLAEGSDGGGTTPVPNDPPPPTPDITAPVISNVVIDQITTSGFRVSWTTDEASDTRLDYGIDATYGSQTSLAASLVTAHSQTITGLQSGVTYHVRARSRDAAGNLALSSDRVASTTATQPAPGPEPPGSSTDVSNISELNAALANLSLSTIVVNPGTYLLGSEVAADYFLPPLARPSSNPLLIRALNVPADPSDPHDVIFKGRMYFRNRRGSYTTWQGFSFEDVSVGTTGIVVFGAYGEPGPDHVTFLDTRMVDNIPLNGANSHHFYLSDGSSHDILIDRYYVEGVSHTAFSGIHGYHNPLGTRFQVKHASLNNLYAGLLMYGDLTNFLGEDIAIDNVRSSVDIIGVQGTLRRVDATNVEPGTSRIKSSGSGGSGPIVLDDCSGLPAVTA